MDAETSFEELDAILKLDGYARVVVTYHLGENILCRCIGLFALKNGEVSEQGSWTSPGRKRVPFPLYTVSREDGK